MQSVEETDAPSIFVSVPSYRDKETPRTLQQLFAKARYPGRVTVLVNEQNITGLPPRGRLFGDPADVGATKFPGASRYARQIRLLQQPASQAKGPIVARAQIEAELYTTGEADYWMQIDSHMAFVKDWDTRLLDQHAQLPDPDRNLITTFPDDYDPVSRQVPSLALPTFIGFHDFHFKRGFPTQQRYRYRSFPAMARESLFYGACFTFGAASVMEEVRYDPTLDYLFLGEEISMAARLFTHGVRLYNPTATVVYHLTDRSYRPTFWEQLHLKNSKASAVERQQRKQMEQTSLKAVQKLLRTGEASSPEHGLGAKHTLEEFERHIGVDLRRMVATPRSKLGIVDDACEAEWREKYGCESAQWQLAVRGLKPALAPKSSS